MDAEGIRAGPQGADVRERGADPGRDAATRWGGLDDEDDIEITLSNRQGQSRTYVIHCLDADYPNITVMKRPGAWDGLILGAVPMG